MINSFLDEVDQVHLNSACLGSYTLNMYMMDRAPSEQLMHLKKQTFFNRKKDNTLESRAFIKQEGEYITRKAEEKSFLLHK